MTVGCGSLLIQRDGLNTREKRCPIGRFPSFPRENGTSWCYGVLRL